ncbi:hypothetical protein [Microbacterium testaceum]|nr:hypothetical protein [Microbacterium testaceum]
MRLYLVSDHGCAPVAFQLVESFSFLPTAEAGLLADEVSTVITLIA